MGVVGRHSGAGVDLLGGSGSGGSNSSSLFLHRQDRKASKGPGHGVAEAAESGVLHSERWANGGACSGPPA